MKNMSIFWFVGICFLTTCCHHPPPPPSPPPPQICDLWVLKAECDCPSDSEYSDILDMCVPLRVDRAVDWGAVRGVTSFALVTRSVEHIKNFTYYMHEHGATTQRTGAQAEKDWCDEDDRDGVDADGDGEDNDFDYLPCGPIHGTYEWERNLKRYLEITARIPDTWVELIPTLTRKSDNPGNVDPNNPIPAKQAINVAHFNAMFDRVHNIVMAGDYKHIIYSAFNEPKHPLSSHLKDEDVLAILKHMRSKTVLPITVDNGGGKNDDGTWKGRYPYVYENHVDAIAFHPPRNPEPTYEEMRRAQDKYDYALVLINEPVAWASDEYIQRYQLEGRFQIALFGKGTEQERMDVVTRQIKDIHRVVGIGGVPWIAYYHSVEGIESRTLFPIPNFDLILD